MTREKASTMIDGLADRHIDAAARYAPPSVSFASERRPAVVRPAARRLIPVAAVVALILAMGIAAYAADLTGFRQIVQVWRGAEPQAAELWDTDTEGTYALVFPDGESVIISGGKGTEDGITVPMSADEILTQWENNFDIQSDRDGKIWLCSQDEKCEITELFDENDTATVIWQNGDTTLTYRVIHRSDGLFEISLVSGLPATAISPEK